MAGAGGFIADSKSAKAGNGGNNNSNNSGSDSDNGNGGAGGWITPGNANGNRKVRSVAIDGGHTHQGCTDAIGKMCFNPIYIIYITTIDKVNPENGSQ
jgi:hypothetical protein